MVIDKPYAHLQPLKRNGLAVKLFSHSQGVQSLAQSAILTQAVLTSQIRSAGAKGFVTNGMPAGLVPLSSGEQDNGVSLMPPTQSAGHVPIDLAPRTISLIAALKGD